MKKYKEQLLVMRVEISEKIDARKVYYVEYNENWKVKKCIAYAAKTWKLEGVLNYLNATIQSLSDYLFEQENETSR